MHGRFVYFIYRIIYILAWIHEHLFYTLSYNPVLFFCRSSCNTSFGYWELFQLAPKSPWHTPIIVCVCFNTLIFFLAIQYTLSSLSLYISCTVLESAVFPSTSGSFHWRIELDQDLVTSYTHCYWDIIAFRLFQLTGNILFIYLISNYISNIF